MKREHSAGGLVLRKKGSKKEKILMVRVRNLEKRMVWTFPKGHLEKDETPEQAAIREVEEETGWNCKVRPFSKNKRTFERVGYFFKRGPSLVKKQVDWFLMEPVKKTGKRDPKEILQTGWFSLEQAKKKVRYPSDIQLLQKLQLKII
jgi:8-oxo-dGTP pyrophosphatase MutT (NUDIX family)